jgi:DNA polymerase epsilon subunit 1
MLKASKSVLWYSPSGFPDLGGGCEDKDFLGEIDYEFPNILNPGLFLGYSVEIDLGLFCVNAILESDNLKDMSGKYELAEKNRTDKPAGHTVIDYHLERDEFVLCANSFHVIKRMAEKLLNDVRHSESVPADILLGNFYRWISSFNSKFFDPVIHRMINKLMYKYFSILVRKIKEFGFEIIFADYKKIFIYNNKSDFNDFNVSLEYLLRTIKKIHIFNHITLTANTYWKVLLFKDNFNFAGISPSEADQEGHFGGKVVSKWTISQFLPPVLERDFISLTSDYLLKLHRFYYEKDITFVMDIFNLHNYNQDGKLWEWRHVIEFMSSSESVKKFKQFLIQDYLANKVFNMIPNIIRKKEEAYDDEELDFEENLEEEQRENNEGRLFSRKDFQDPDEEDEQEAQDEPEGQANNLYRVNNGHNLNDPNEKHDINRLNDKKKSNTDRVSMWDFPVKLGSYQNADNSALEYIKYITYVLSLDEEVSDQAYVLKKNSLKLIKVPEFSKPTEFEDPCRTFVLHDIICEYCATNKDFDFCRDVAILSNSWTCEFCGVQFDKDFIEFLIIHKLKNLVDFYYNQDLKCTKCKMIKNEFIFTRCSCAGEYVKTFEESIFNTLPNIKNLKDYLDVIHNIASYYNFETLKSMLAAIGI